MSGIPTTSFSDGGGHVWNIRFDGLTLAALRDALGINLADVTGDAFFRLETDQSVLTRVVCFLLRDQLAAQQVTDKQFANLLVGDRAEAAMAAMWGAATNFFRPKLLSAVESACKQRCQWQEIAPALAMLNQPDLPDSLRLAMLEQLGLKMTALASGDSPPSADSPSASGQEANPSPRASAGPGPAESARAA